MALLRIHQYHQEQGEVARAQFVGNLLTARLKCLTTSRDTRQFLHGLRQKRYPKGPQPMVLSNQTTPWSPIILSPKRATAASTVVDVLRFFCRIYSRLQMMDKNGVECKPFCRTGDNAKKLE